MQSETSPANRHDILNETSVNNGLSRHHRGLETLLIAAIVVVSLFLFFHTAYTFILIHLYYFPIVLAGFYLGRDRAILFSVFSVLGAGLPIYIKLISTSHVPLFAVVSVFALWFCTLGLIGVLVGTLSDSWRTALEQLNATHKAAVLVDALTNVANRRGFDHELERRLADWKRHRTPVHIVLFDIDCFKAFNDRHGHRAGDFMLFNVAQLLKQTMRDTDLVARYGGEEFIVIISNVDTAQAKDVAERSRSLIESTRFKYDGMTLRCTVSVGLSRVIGDETGESAVQRADGALYCSKEAGRNSVYFHDGVACQRYGNGLAVAPSNEGNGRGLESADPNMSTDAVTGLPTLRVLLDELRRRVAESARYDTDLSIALVALNDFGHTALHDVRAEKTLLTTVARMSRSSVREHEIVARYDESSFCILLPATSLSDALVPMSRLSQRASQFTDVTYSTMSFSVSIGIAQLSEREDAGSLLQRAEQALLACFEADTENICLHNGQVCEFPQIGDAVVQSP